MNSFCIPNSVRQSITSATDALELVGCLNDSQRVTSVELRYSEYFCGTHHNTPYLSVHVMLVSLPHFLVVAAITLIL